MSDYDETDRSEDEEDDERVEDSHKSRLTAAQNWIIDAVGRRKKVEETTKRVKLTEEDVDQFFGAFPDLTHDLNENAPTLLHVIVDLVSSTVGVSIDSATVKALVQRLLQQCTRLLCICNDDQQNPLYLAIARKKKILVDYMIASCPQEDSQRWHLATALEDSRGNEKRKNCLHLAFEKDMKPTTLLRMVKDASIKALEAVDTTGRRPMHYAVQYAHCNVEVIRAFIERDNEARQCQIMVHGTKPDKTFLDVDEEAQTSVYQEHVSSALAYNDDRKSRQGMSDHTKKKPEILTARDDGGKHTRGQGDVLVKDRSAMTKSIPEPRFVPRPGNRVAAQTHHAKSAASHELWNLQDQAGRPRGRDREKRMGDDDTLTELEQKREEFRRLEAEARAKELGEEVGKPEAAREMSKDRQGLGPATRPGGIRIQTTFEPRAVAKSSKEITANTPKPLIRLPETADEVEDGNVATRVKQTAADTKKSRKPTVDHEAAAHDSKTVLRMLKLHYMRTRNIQKATSWLYKTNPQDVQTFFDYHMLPSELKEDLFEKAFQVIKFDEVLQYVHFTNVTVIRRQKPNSKNDRPRGGLGRRDMEFFFNFLHKKGVRYILKLVVEEGVRSVHSDEAIKNSLDRIIVEHLDWRKVDLDPQLICGISSQAEDMLDKNEGDAGRRNQLRQLDLQWSGNSAILRAWSEPEGLASLPHLETVNITVPDDTVLYDSTRWILEKKNEFEERLNKFSLAIDPEQRSDVSTQDTDHRKITVNLRGLSSASDRKSDVGLLQFGQTLGRMSQDAPQKIINTHEWLNCIDAFARNINLLWTSTRAGFLSSIGAAGLGTGQETASRPAGARRLENEVIVALIDDGVSLLDQSFVGRILEGKTFDYRDSGIDHHHGGVGQWYNSANGHGTEMARCILRVCPMAKIYPIRLKTHVSADGRNTEIDLDSAASAINAALEKEATIISMSWTIPVPKEPGPAQNRFEAAVRKACSRNVLMFCSSSDDGHITNINYPSAVQRDKVFRIGAAHDHGLAYKYVGKDVDFILPGVNVNVSATSAATGSSVATALAAGLAATIIYCCKISALAVKTQTQTMSHDQILRQTFTESAVLKLSHHEDMKAAFGMIGQVNDARFIQIWDTLQPVVQKLEDISNTDDHITKVGLVMNLCNKLMTH